ncbi:MAG: hypothetical protein JJD92_16370 [Frankiaceae bacterium]|nr:hypothetical protein [Frankiaceae bacterium]
MMTPEDRLRQILQLEAEDLVPAGDGLRRIEQRLSQRRTLRSRIVPAVAIAGVVAVAGAAAITVSLTDDGALKVPEQRASSAPNPAPSTCAVDGCVDPTPSAVPSPLPSPVVLVTTSANGTPVWPFTTNAQASEWLSRPGSRSWAADPVKVVAHLMSDYLKLPGQATRRINDDADVAIVEVSAGGRPVSQVRLERVGQRPAGPWSVTAAFAEDLIVSRPKDGEDVTSPLQTSGTVTGVDESVHVRLMTDALLDEGHAPAGNVIPWSQPLRWSKSDWSIAAVVASTYDGKGDLHAVTITAVRRSTAPVDGVPGAGSVLVAVDQQHIVTVDTSTGQQLRQLSFPESAGADAIDSAPDRGGEDGVVWVRTRGDGCTSSIIRVGLAHGPAGVTVDAKPLRRGLPALSSGGRSLAWVERPCTGGDTTIVVRGPDANFSTVATSGEPVTDLDVRDDGYAVVQLGKRVVVLPPGATDMTSARTLTPDDGCTLAAPAWDAAVAVAWQSCPAGWRLGRWVATGGAATSSIAVSVRSGVLHTAVTSGQLLVALEDHGIARLVNGMLDDIPNALRWGQPDW